MGFEITPTAVQLRELLPDVAASMEEKLVRVQMASLKIEHAYYRRNKTLVIEIPLTNNFYMRLSPVDVGPGNYHEFFSVVKTPALRHPDGRRIAAKTKETIRMHVEIYDGSITNIFSHTIHQESLEQLIKTALDGFYQMRNIALKPLPKKSPVSKRKSNPNQPPLQD